MLLNRDGKVFVGRGSIIPTRPGRCPRAGSTRARSPWATAKRELEEETGISPQPHRADRRMSRAAEATICPTELQSKLWGGKWKGQLQDWYLARFLGDDSDVNIATKHPEFNDWKWIEPEQLPDLIVPFKRDLYRRLLQEFAEYL